MARDAGRVGPRRSELTADMVAMAERIGVPQTGDALLGAFLMDLLWSDETDDAARDGRPGRAR